MLVFAKTGDMGAASGMACCAGRRDGCTLPASRITSQAQTRMTNMASSAPSAACVGVGSSFGRRSIKPIHRPTTVSGMHRNAPSTSGTTGNPSPMATPAAALANAIHGNVVGTLCCSRLRPAANIMAIRTLSKTMGKTCFPSALIVPAFDCWAMASAARPSSPGNGLKQMPPRSKTTENTVHASDVSATESSNDDAKQAIHGFALIFFACMLTCFAW